MKNRLLSTLGTVLLVLILCGRSITADAASGESLDLSGMTHDEVASYMEMFREMPELQTVNLGRDGRPDFGWEDVGTLQEALPDVEFEYAFSLFGQDFTTLSEQMDFRHVTMEDEGAAVRAVLPYMTRCRKLDMDFTGVSGGSMAEIRDDFPEIEVVWRVWFGTDCSVRTDVERILASNLNHKLTDENTGDLQYCTKVRLLDIGHNTNLTNFEFLRSMPDLEVAILGLTGLRDLSPISGCTKLEYLEINTLYWGQDLDLAPLRTLTNLEHLDICRLGYVKNWEVLEQLTGLKRLWIGRCTWLPEGAREEMEAALPDTEMDWDTDTGSDEYWRFTRDGGYTERYELLREQFEYSMYSYVSSSWYNDPLYYAEGEQEYRPEIFW